MNSTGTFRFRQLFPFLLFYVIVDLLCINNPFFWDTVQLGSRQALWFYENNFKHLFLPLEIDSGHCPLFGIYLATFWKILGKSLVTSHLAMLPFLVGIAWQFYRICIHFLTNKWTNYAMLFLLLEPTVLAQSTLVSPDIVLLFLFLVCINSILRNHKMVLMFSLIPLSLISMRGAMTVASICLIDLILEYRKNKSFLPWSILKKVVVYVPAFILVVVWMMLHFNATGWNGYSQNSSWIACFEPVNFQGFLKNMLILGWRIVDFGRIYLWLPGFIILVYLGLKGSFSKQHDSKIFIIILICFIPLLCYMPSFLLFKNLSAHRYIMPVFPVFGLLFIYLISNYCEGRKMFFVVMILIGLGTGNFWRYPVGISQGWDASLAYLPWFKVRAEMLDYIHTRNLKTEVIGTTFPNKIGTQFTDLSKDSFQFKDKDLAKDSMVFQSNIMNDFSEDELAELQTKWQLEKEVKNLWIYGRLYKRMMPIETAP